MSNFSKLFQTAEETEVAETVDIEGTLPGWLKGTYYRVGPAMFDFEDKFTMNHLFDGYAMISKFSITPKNVSFEKKFLKSDAYTRAMAAQKPVVTEFGTPACTDPNKSLISKVLHAMVPEFTDNDYSTLFTLGPDLFCMADTCFFRKVDCKNLGESSEKCDATKLFGVNSQSAHPLTDPKTGDVWNVGFTLFSGLKYHVFKIPCGKSSKEMLKKSQTIATFSSRWNGSFGAFHSFGMTENFVIFIEQPYVATVAKLCTALVKRTAARDWLEWRGGEEKNRFVIISKTTGKVYKTDFYSKEPFYFIHVINCHEEDRQLIIDIITYEDASILETFNLKNLRQNLIVDSSLPRSERYVIPLVEDIKKVPEGSNLVKHPEATAVRHGHRIILSPASLCSETGLEFPTINRSHVGRKASFAYTMGPLDPSSVFRNKIAKLNMDTKEVVTFSISDHFFPGEPIFIPQHGDDDKDRQAEEDDGIVLAPFSNTIDPGQDCLVFLDETMKEIARATFKNDVPSAFHGIFLRDN